MTNPQRAARPAGKTPSGSQPNNSGRYLAIMIGGGLVALLGFYWVLQNYSSNPTKFYIGLTLLAVGGLAGFISAIIRSNIRARRQGR